MNDYIIHLKAYQYQLNKGCIRELTVEDLYFCSKNCQSTPLSLLAGVFKRLRQE